MNHWGNISLHYASTDPSSIIAGSKPALAKETIEAMGLNSHFLTLSLDIINKAAAPSLIPD